MGARANARILVRDQRLHAGLVAALVMEGYTVQSVGPDEAGGEPEGADEPDLLVIDLRSVQAEVELARHLPSGAIVHVPQPATNAETKIEVGDLVLDPSNHLATRDDHHLSLTATEFSILALLARQPGAVISKTTMLSELRGNNGQSVNVVEVHVSSLRRKLESRGPRIIHTVRGVGYALTPV
jgi:hypothetical protein